ncbi:myosin heavy chain, clone 203-like isoform X3 [Palaemon carinicauda]
MEVQDTYRYQEAVQRLKKLLYNGSVEPLSFHFEEKYSGYNSRHSATSFHKDLPKDRGGAKRFAAELDNGSEGLSRKRRDAPEGVWCLMELLRHQEELIAQLEKENEFLKREILSVSDGAKKVAQENQDLGRRLAQALSQALAQDEALDSSLSTSNSQGEKATESIDKLQREKTALMAEVDRLQSALDAMTEREQNALDKLRAALAIAEETQAFTTQVRASSESAIEEISGLLRATKEEEEQLKFLLEEARKKSDQHEEEQEEWKSQQQKQIKLLEEEVNDRNTQIAQLEGDVREKGVKIAILKDDLQAAQAAKARLETQLEEQRQHSKDAHARLDNIIMTRSAEAATASTRARELEDRLSSARQDISRLLSTITSIAQGPGKTRDLQSTDDVKSERLAAEHQMSTLLSSLQDRHEEEVKALHDASAEHRKSVDALRKEVTEMRRQILDDNEQHSRELMSQVEEIKRLHDHLNQSQEHLVRLQEQAQIHGVIHQQVLEKLQKMGSKLNSTEQQNENLIESLRMARSDCNHLQQEVTFLRKVTANATAINSSSSPKPLPEVVTEVANFLQDKSLRSVENHSTETYTQDLTAAKFQVLANDGAFKNVVVAPGVTLLQMYQ